MADLGKKTELDEDADKLNRKRNGQQLLADDYEKTLNSKTYIDSVNRDIENMRQQRDVDQAHKEGNAIALAEAQKKQWMKAALHGGQEDMKMRQQWAAFEKKKGQDQTTKNYEEWERRLNQNEKAFKNRFVDALSRQDKISQNYRNGIMKEQEALMHKTINDREKQIKEQENIFERNQAAADATKLLKKRQYTHDIDEQYRQQQAQKTIGQEEANYFNHQSNRLENTIKQHGQLEKDQDRERKIRYKQMLDDQTNQQRQMVAYGNMTEAEKKLNKNDLVSYKNKEHVNYGLIPGINSSPQHLTRVAQMKQDKRQAKPDKTMQRIDQFGSTYLGQVQDGQGVAANISFPASPEVGRAPSYQSKKVHPFYQSMDQNMSNLDVLNNQKQLGQSAIYQPQPHSQLENNHVKVPQPDETNPMNTFRAHHLYGHFNPVNNSYKPKVVQTERTMFRNTAENLLR